MLEDLWHQFCDLRIKSRAYRAVDDPVVKQAYEKWRQVYELDGAPGDNVIPFSTRRIWRG